MHENSLKSREGSVIKTQRGFSIFDDCFKKKNEKTKETDSQQEYSATPPLTTGGPSSHLEKKQMIKSQKHRTLCDLVLSCERNL